jgi:hypothetical protein
MLNQFLYQLVSDGGKITWFGLAFLALDMTLSFRLVFLVQQECN